MQSVCLEFMYTSHWHHTGLTCYCPNIESLVECWSNSCGSRPRWGGVWHTCWVQAVRPVLTSCYRNTTTPHRGHVHSCSPRHSALHSRRAAGAAQRRCPTAFGSTHCFPSTHTCRRGWSRKSGSHPKSTATTPIARHPTRSPKARQSRHTYCHPSIPA